MSNKIIITDTEKRNVTIDIQLGYTDKKFNHISISRELKYLQGDGEYDVISISVDELRKICKELFKIVRGMK